MRTYVPLFVCLDLFSVGNKLARFVQYLHFICFQEEIFSSSFATAAYLDSIKFDKKAYIIGGSGIGQELTEVGISWRGIDVCVCNRYR